LRRAARAGASGARVRDRGLCPLHPEKGRYLFIVMLDRSPVALWCSSFPAISPGAIRKSKPCSSKVTTGKHGGDIQEVTLQPDNKGLQPLVVTPAVGDVRVVAGVP